MGAYKKLNKQDAYITTYSAHKSWALSGSQFTSYGIERKNATSVGKILENLQQLYYRPKASVGTFISHSFDLYDQTTLFFSSSRNLTTGSQVISIPRQLYGTNIRPNTFRLTLSAETVETTLPFLKGYVTDGYVQDSPTLYETTTEGVVQRLAPGGGGGPIIITVKTYTFLDDAEGNLYLSGSTNTKVGDIIYPHGMAIITNPNYIDLVRGVFETPASLSKATMSFQNTQPIFTHNYHCRVRDLEYNFTYNPSALSSSLKTVYDNDGNLYSTSLDVGNGLVKSNLTGSAFQPYITTVGLYNDANQLIAVGKMPRPVPKSANTEMTIIVKIDI